jgi:hypothetical protein
VDSVLPADPEAPSGANRMLPPEPTAATPRAAADRAGDLRRLWEQVGDAVAERAFVHAVLGEDLGRDAVAGGDRQQEVLAARAAVVGVVGLGSGTFEGALESRDDAVAGAVRRLAVADRRGDRVSYGRLGDTEVQQRRAGEAVAGGEQAEQDVLGLP